MQITFYGAAGEVTGSCSLLETVGAQILIDCGMFQGDAATEAKNKQPFLFDPSALSAVFITHAHLDHVGRLPLLVRGGFSGFIYATLPTAELIPLILEDAWHVMQHHSKATGAPVLYDITDIAIVESVLKPCEYDQPLSLPTPNGDTIVATWSDVGHIFGSAFITIATAGKQVVFSGDVGNVHVPIVRDSAPLPGGLNALVLESTYGDRQHQPASTRAPSLTHIVSDTVRHGGTVLIPSFALERTHELLYTLNELVDHSRGFPNVPIFLDSPLAIRALKIYRHYSRYFDEAAQERLREGDDVFNFPGLHITETVEESKRINQERGSKIIIAGSGMMNGGRILHHALRYLSDPQSTLVLIGYQGRGTLGRRISEGHSPVEIYGERVAVRCHVEQLHSFSAHGDQEKLVQWVRAANPPPQKVFLNHGDVEAAAVLEAKLRGFGIETQVVEAGMKAEV